jgi:hypothetical protein
LAAQLITFDSITVKADAGWTNQQPANCTDERIENAISPVAHRPRKSQRSNSSHQSYLQAQSKLADIIASHVVKSATIINRELGD